MEKLRKQEKGITLLALVVTIIVLLIIAGTAINLTIGEDGIFTRAKMAAERYKAEEIKEKMEILKTNTIIDNKGKFNIEDFFDNLVEEGIVGSKEDIIDNGDGTHTIITDEGFIMGVTEGEDGTGIEIEYAGKGDISGPRIKEIIVKEKTASTIEIEVNATNITGAKYTYSYRINGEVEYVEAGKEIKDNTYIFENLQSNKLYDIKVEVENEGIKTEKEISVYTGELPEGAITLGEVEWNDGKAQIQVHINTEIGENLRLEYKINEQGTWKEIQDGEKIENLEHNQTVYVRLTDGTNETEYASASIKDTNLPEVSIDLGTITSNSLEISVMANDKETGLATENTYEYFLNGITQGANTDSTHIFNNLTDGIKYTLKVKVVDKAGNTNEAEIEGTTNTVTSGKEQGAITFTSPTWINGTASISVNTNTSYQIEYQKNNTTGSWTKITSGGTISSLNHNDTIYARLTDGINSGDYTSTSIEDTIAPTVEITTSNVTQTSITLNVVASDDQSGLASSNAYSYYLNDNLIVSNNTNSYTFSDLTPDTSYKLKVLVKDKAGKTTEKVTTIATKRELITFTMGIQYTAEKGMTWREWVESEYNTAGLLITKYDLVAYDYEFGEDLGIPEIGNVTVYADDVIDETLDYYDGYGYVLYHN